MLANTLRPDVLMAAFENGKLESSIPPVLCAGVPNTMTWVDSRIIKGVSKYLLIVATESEQVISSRPGHIVADLPHLGITSLRLEVITSLGIVIP